MDTRKPKVVVVAGPTASGKTDLAIEMALRFNGEVISADSRQVYRGLNIGTGKVTEAEMRGIPHHLIDVRDVNEPYTAADFKRDAASQIEDIVSREKLPIIAGGTFFYIDTLLERVPNAPVPPNPELRDYLEELPVEVLHRRLEEVDSKRALEVDRHNKRRVIRALEIVEELGAVPTETEHECPYDVLFIGIDIERNELRERFRTRGEQWLSSGFQKEVEKLLENGVTRDRLHEIGFEYQLMLELIDGTIDSEIFIQKFIEKNWQYAKRQLTWLRRDDSIQWFAPNETKSILRTIEKFLENGD